MMKARTRKQAFHTIVLSLAFLMFGAIFAYGQQKRVVPGPKELPFSDGVVVGNTLYIAGQEGVNENGKLKAGGIGPETEAALQSLAKVVKAAGFELKDVVSVTVYLADMRDFEAMNKVYGTFMPEPKPTRTTVQVVRLPVNDSRIEISAIAVKQR